MNGSRKTVVARVLAATLVSFMLALPSGSSFAADDSPIIRIVANPTDGHLRMNGDEGWDALRASEDSSVFDDLRYVKINTRPDIIYRGFLFFDTSHLGHDVEYGSARLNIYAKCTGDLDDCHLYVLACPPGFPHEPLESSDCALPWDRMTICAHVDAGRWTELAYREIPLTDPSILNTTGVTAFCLVERRDYENATPPDIKSENEIKLFSSEEGTGYQPYLEVGPREPATTVHVTPGVAAAVVLLAACIGFVLLRRRHTRVS